MLTKVKKLFSQLWAKFNSSEHLADVKRRQYILAGGILLIMVLLLWLLLRSGNSERTQAPPIEVQHHNFTSPLQDVDPITLYLDELQQKLASANGETTALASQIDNLKDTQSDTSEQMSDQASTLRTLQAMLAQQEQQEQVREHEEWLTSDKEFTDPSEPYLPRPAPSLTQQVISDPALPSMQVLDIALTDIPAVTLVKTSAHYIPPGTFVRAVMLNGLDADTSVNGQGNPKPVVMRITAWGNLPNHYQSRLKDCVVVGAGIGDISSERAYIRLDTLSCTLNDARIIDVKAFGHVVDSSDGKVGVKGKLRMGAGRSVSNAFFAGVLSGVGNGISQQYTTTYASPLGQSSTLDPSRSLQYGLAAGVGESGNRMADYFIRRADQYNPVVQVPPQAVDIIFIKQGIWLDDSTATNSGSAAAIDAADNRTLLDEEIKQAASLFKQNP